MKRGKRSGFPEGRTSGGHGGAVAITVVDPEVLRDQGDAPRIERIWESLESNIAFEAMEARPSLLRARWVPAAALLAAGFALGIGASVAGGSLWQSDADTDGPLVMAPTNDGTPQEVFAAGRLTREYALPGGGSIALTPGSIVDTVARDGQSLTLRLIRGEATLVSAAAGGGHALQIGEARVNALDGRLRVRLDGSTAELQMLAGTAAVTSPDTDLGTRRTQLKPHQRATVPVRIVTARVPTPPRPIPDEEVDDLAVEPGPEVGPSAAVAAIDGNPVEVQRGPAAWVTACSQGQYVSAVEQLAKEPGGVQAALGGATSASLLSCIASGSEQQDNALAMAAYERVVREFGDNAYAATAARSLERMHHAAGNHEQAKVYAQLRSTLSKGRLLSEGDLCQKIEQEEAAGHAEVALRLSERYVAQYPNSGSCMDTAQRIIAAAKKDAPEKNDTAGDGADGASSDAAGDEPYEDDDPADGQSPDRPSPDAPSAG